MPSSADVVSSNASDNDTSATHERSDAGTESAQSEATAPGDLPTKVATELTHQLAELTSKDIGVNEVPTRVAPDTASRAAELTSKSSSGDSSKQATTGFVGRRPVTEQTRTVGRPVEPAKPSALPPSRPANFVGRRPGTESTRTGGPTTEQTSGRPITEQTKTPVEPDITATPSKRSRRPSTEHTEADGPARRSSFDQTPLPGPLPYHVADPTTSSLERISASRLSESGISDELLDQLAELRLSDIEIPDAGDSGTVDAELDAARGGAGEGDFEGEVEGESSPTRPGEQPRLDRSTMRELPMLDSSGFASAARRISALVSGSSDEELVTHEVARLDPGEVEAARSGDVASTSASAAAPAAESLRSSEIELAAEDAESIESIEVSAVEDEPRRASRSSDSDSGSDSDSVVTGVDDHDSEFTSPRDLPMGTGVTRLPDDSSLVGLDNAFFAPVPVRQRGRAHARFTIRTVKPGAIVIRQGESNHALVAVVTGRLAVIAERVDADAITLGFVDDGDFIGEASLLARKPAPAQVIATTDAVVMTLSGRDLFELAAAYPLLWSALKDRAEKYNRDLEAKLRG